MSSGSRVLPHNIEAEKSVLGGVLLRNDALNDLDQLDEEDFYDPRHRALFAAIRALENRSKPIDEVTLEEQLRINGKLEAIGGLAYIAELALAVPTADNIRHYAEIIQDKHTARKLMLAASDIASKGYETFAEVAEYLEEAEAKIFEVTQRNQRGGAVAIKQLLKELFKDFDTRYSASDGITGVPTYFTDLDKRTAGLHPSDLVILAARPAMGKTSLALSIARNAAMTGGFPVLIFSLEMSSLQLTERMLCSEGEIDAFSLRSGQIQRRDMTNLTRAADALSRAPILIDDTPAMTLREVRAKARRFRGDKRLFDERGFDRGLLVVDYLQLMHGSPTNRSGSREQEISEISRGLKSLAKEINCPVIALSQLNRSLEQRPNKRPILSDLRESGAIEQDADMILFIYRDEVYDEASEKKGVAEVIIGKNRHGPIGTSELRFVGKHTRFENLSYREDDLDDYGPPPDDIPQSSPDGAPF